MKRANGEVFTCKTFKKHLRAYVDNELSGSVKAEFIAHASQCDACGKSLAGMENVIRSLASLKPVDTSGEFTITMKTRILLERDRLQNPLYRASLYLREKFRFLVAVPAVATAVIIAVFVYTGTVNDTPFTNVAQETASETTEAVGEDLITVDESNPDEIVYIYYVLETLDDKDRSQSLTGPADPKRPVGRRHPVDNGLTTVSF